jgi:hypothetical protein
MPDRGEGLRRLLDNPVTLGLLDRAPDGVRRDLDAVASLFQTEGAAVHEGAIRGQTVASG